MTHTHTHIYSRIYIQVNILL